MDKKVYTSADVQRFLDEVKKGYEDTLFAQRERIDSLKAQCDELEKENRRLTAGQNAIARSITKAVEKADEIQRITLIKYNQEIAALKSFHDKWQSYYTKIIEKYPLDDDLVAASRVNSKISAVLDDSGALEEQFERESQRLRGAEETASAIDSKSSSGFSFEEALHPKEKLEDILKELGVVYDED